MKLVICFDTEDEQGMENCIKIVNHLADSYRSKKIEHSDEVPFSKLELRRIIRGYLKKAQDSEVDLFGYGEQESSTNIDTRNIREYVEEVFCRKRENKTVFYL